MSYTTMGSLPPSLILNLYGLLGHILVVRLFYLFIKRTQP